MNAPENGRAVSLSALRGVALFEGLDDTQCRQLATIVHQYTCLPGEILLRQGETEQDLWVILTGTCEVIRQREGRHAAAGPIVLARLDAGETLGEMSFFQPAPHSASVRVCTTASLLRISRAGFDGLLQNGSCAAYKLAVNIVGTLARRLRQMDQWVADLLDDQADRRVAEWSQFRERMLRDTGN